MSRQFRREPDLSDTDDDGLLDGAEISAGTSPLSGLDPYISRAVQLDEDAYVELALAYHGYRFALDSFTLEAWVYLGVDADGGAIIQRQVGMNEVNYELGLMPGASGQLVPYARTNTKY